MTKTTTSMLWVRRRRLLDRNRNPHHLPRAQFPRHCSVPATSLPPYNRDQSPLLRHLNAGNSRRKRPQSCPLPACRPNIQQASRMSPSHLTTSLRASIHPSLTSTKTRKCCWPRLVAMLATVSRMLRRSKLIKFRGPPKHREPPYSPTVFQANQEMIRAQPLGRHLRRPIRNSLLSEVK